MKRWLEILCSALLLAALAVVLVLQGVYAEKQRAQIEVRRVRVSVADSASMGDFVTAAAVRRWIDASGVKYNDMPIDAVNTHEIERSILSHSFVRDAQVYTDMDGTLGVRIRQRRPVVRICTSNGYDFFLSEDCHVLPATGSRAAYVPIVTGVVSLPFRPGEWGDYGTMIRERRDDFVARYSQLKNQSDELGAQLLALRAEKREVQADRPFLFKMWGKEKKAEFVKNRDLRLSALDREIADCMSQADDAKKKMLGEVEKQKKSEKTYEFLPKLLTFVKNLAEDDFWNAQIVQINLTEGIAGHQPEVELVPRAGAHVIRLGHLDDVEAKLDKLMLFYRHVLDYEGWNCVRYIDLRFDNQIVCTK